MTHLAIKGHATRGKEVIEILEMLGGKRNVCTGIDNMRYYVIDIDNKLITPLALPDNVHTKLLYSVFTLEQFLEKFPYKVGDKVYVDSVDYQGEGIITELFWVEEKEIIHYKVESDKCDGWWGVNELKPYKEETMEEKLKEKCDLINFNSHHIFNFADRVELIIGDKWEIKNEDGRILVVKKQPQFPKTYKECLCIREVGGVSPKVIDAFKQLILARNAYWKIAGDWKPDWEDDEWNDMYYISFDGKNIHKETGYPCCNVILIFPTEEMRDEFYENFKELIEECKELL